MLRFFLVFLQLSVLLLPSACSSLPEQPISAGRNIICFGDSLTSGTGAPPEESYPARLSGLIGRPVINAGLAGDTTSRALTRLERDVLAKSPGMVLITLGGNDLKNGVDKKTAFRNLRKIVETIQARDALVVIGGLKVPFWDRGYAAEYEKLAEETGAVLVPNILGGIMGNHKLMHDRIHPNSAGYAVMAEKFYQAVKPFL